MSTAGLRAWLPRVFAIDLRSLGAFRVALSAAVVYDLAYRVQDLEAHYADSGLFPISQVLPKGSYRIAPHVWNGSIAYQGTLFAIAAACAVLMAVGFRTRVFTVLSCGLHASLCYRNREILHGADDLLSLLLLWSMFLPLGARISIDARLARRTGAAQLPNRYYSAATAALLLQVAFLYLFTGLLKLKVPSWRDGTMLSLILENDWFVSDIGRLVQPHDWLTVPLTYGTLFIEIVVPFVILIPNRACRVLGLLLLAGLQVGTEMCMILGIFPVVYSTALLPFVPTWMWDKLLPMTRTAPAAEIARGGSQWANRLVWVLTFWSLVTNVASIRGRSVYHRLPDPIVAVGDALAIEQSWAMFADPEAEDGWLVVEGTLADGRKINALRPEEPLSWDKPPSVARSLPGPRWNDSMQRVIDNHRVEFWRAYEAFRKRRWNRTHPPKERLVGIRAVYFFEPIPAGRSPVIERDPLWP